MLSEAQTECMTKIRIKNLFTSIHKVHLVLVGVSCLHTSKT